MELTIGEEVGQSSSFGICLQRAVSSHVQRMHGGSRLRTRGRGHGGLGSLCPAAVPSPSSLCPGQPSGARRTPEDAEPGGDTERQAGLRASAGAPALDVGVDPPRHHVVQRSFNPLLGRVVGVADAHLEWAQRRNMFQLHGDCGESPEDGRAQGRCLTSDGR